MYEYGVLQASSIEEWKEEWKEGRVDRYIASQNLHSMLRPAAVEPCLYIRDKACTVDQGSFIFLKLAVGEMVPM